MNLPNKLTLIRIFLIPLMVATFYMTFIPYNYLITGLIFAISSFTDFLDGNIARKRNLVTDLGKFLDPIADKILVLTSLVIILTKPQILGGGVAIYTSVYFGNLFYQLVGGIGVSIIVAREMLVSVLRMMASQKGLVLAAEKVGKIKTFITDIAIAVLFISFDLLATTFGVIVHFIGVALFVISVILTIYSGCYYLIKNKGVFAQ